MQLTPSYIKQRFDKYNGLIFGGRLPDIPIRLSKARGYLGRFTYRIVKGKKTDFSLRFSTLYDLPEDLFDDVIIHEMIHYYLAFADKKDNKPHGDLFCLFMNEINRKYGRNVRISYKLPKEEREKAVKKLVKVRVVAVVKFIDGRTGVKVLPRIRETIQRYHQVYTHSPNVASIKLYVTVDSFFALFRSSGALRAYLVDAAELEQHLVGAKELIFDGRDIKIAP